LSQLNSESKAIEQAAVQSKKCSYWLGLKWNLP
jgi:hypothetical protein